MKECILKLNSSYLHDPEYLDAIQWDILAIDPDTNKIILKDYRKYYRLLHNGKFLSVPDMVRLIKTNTLAVRLYVKGYYWGEIVYVDGKNFSM